MRASTFRRLLNLWPPFLVNAIRVQSLSDDYTEAKVVLRLRPWNRNYVKSQFGGNLFAMVDPFWMLLAMHQLGVRLLLEGEPAAGLDQFLTILQNARDWNEGQGKKRLLAAFATLDDAELVSRYRRKMASLLF